MSKVPVIDDEREKTDDENNVRAKFLKLITRGDYESHRMFYTLSAATSIASIRKSWETMKANNASYQATHKVFSLKSSKGSLNLEKKTTRILDIKRAEDNHQFSARVKKIRTPLFNLFAKNLVSEENSKIHQTRKRLSKNPKASSTARKAKKVCSNCHSLARYHSISFKLSRI